MFIEIIKNTPIWVFVLFILLLFLGYTQTKNRKINLKRIFILPIAMICLSIFSIISAFGIIKISLFLWLIGNVIAFFIGVKLISYENVKYDNIQKVYYIPGSWTPMILILIIFFLKYFIGVITALELPIRNEIEFIIIISLLYGLISGVFLARSIVVSKTRFLNR